MRAGSQGDAWFLVAGRYEPRFRAVDMIALGLIEQVTCP